MAVESNFQDVADRFGRALEFSRGLLDIYPNPRPQGAPPKKLRPLPAAITLGVVAAFEGFAEDTLATALYREGRSWAQIAAKSDLSNPSLKTLVDRVHDQLDIDPDPGPRWETHLVRQQKYHTSWALEPVTWAELVRESDGWIQVRHCLTHGVVTGLGPERWPGDVNKKSRKNESRSVKASDVLARTSTPDDGRRGIYFWGSVACARIHAQGGAEVLNAVAEAYGEDVDSSVLLQFEGI